MPTHAHRTRKEKIGFVALIFASSEISKTINVKCYLNMVQPMSEQDKNEMVQILNKMVH